MDIVLAFDGDEAGQRAALGAAIKLTIEKEKNTPSPLQLAFAERFGGFRGIPTSDLVCELQNLQQQLRETPLTKAGRQYTVRYINDIQKEIERRKTMPLTGKFKSNSETIQAIREKTNLADIMANYTEVFVHQRQSIFRCTLHGEDKVPSGTIDNEKQLWHCFGCNCGGDVFSAVMAFEKVDFMSAVRLLGKNLGIDI